MRVCIITTKMNFATAGGSVGDIDLRAKILLERGHTVTVVSAFSDFNRVMEPLPYRLKEESIKTTGLLGIQVGTYHLLKKYENDTDIFHIDGQVFLYGAGFYRLTGGKVPVLGFFNHWLTAWADETVATKKSISFFLRCAKALKKRARFLLEQTLGVLLANRLDAFIYNTPQVRERFMRSGFQDGSVLPDFADTEGMRRREQMTTAKISERQCTNGSVTILCAGRMLPEKGFHMVIEALALLKDKEHYKVIMSGTGPEFQKLKELSAALRVEHLVLFPGWVERTELLQFFREAQVFIFPNWWMEYGSVALEEAMSLGLASIIPAGGALQWLSGGTALTFVPESIPDLARAMQNLGEDPELRIAVAQKQLARAALLDYRVLGKELERILSTFAR